MVTAWRAAVAALAMGLSPAAAEAREFAIGGGISVSLGDGWTGTFMKNPAMEFPGMREMIDDATEARLHGPDSGVLVSYMKLKTAKDASAAQVDDAGIVADSAKTVYAAQAQETEFAPTIITVGDTVRAFVTLHARPGAAFNVAPGYPGGCVTTGVIRKGAAIHNVSIASDSCESAAHLEAVAAIFGPDIRPAG